MTPRPPHRRPAPTALAAALAALAAALAPAAAVPAGNPFAGARLYVEPAGPAADAARRAADPAEAAALARIAATPQALWLTGPGVRPAAARRVAAARRAGALPVLVAYNVPGRDCGGHSEGGVAGHRAYARWVTELARGIGAGPAVVVLEPDALAEIACLGPAARVRRTATVAAAAARLARGPRTAVYLDAGHAGWVPPAEMARRLRRAGVHRARGFAVNVANFRTTAESRRYGRRISALLGGVPFVIDTSRNGAGPAPGGAWCNPAGRAAGAAPTARTGDPRVDALLWVKRPGESDGPCGGGPPAGRFWPEYAIGLVRRATG